MASLQGLPPLPKSLSGLLNFSSSQRKEMQRLHNMKAMIQQDLNQGPAQCQLYHQDHGASGSSPEQQSQHSSKGDLRGSPWSHPYMSSLRVSPPGIRVRKASTLDGQLALLRKEMVGLRQLDMSLLCQLWTLNESIQEFKQLLQERAQQPASPPAWDIGMEQSSADEGDDYLYVTQYIHKNRPVLNSVPEQYSSSSSSRSSMEFGDI